MQIEFENNANNISFKNNIFLFAFALILILPTVLLLKTIGPNYQIIAFVCALPAVILLILNLNLTYALFIVSLFNFVYVSYASSGEIFSIIVIAAFLMSYRFKSHELKNPLLLPFFIFIALILPSYINSFMLVTPVLVSFRLVAFVCIFTFTAVIIDNYEKIERYLGIYLFLSVLNGLHIIYEALITGKRVFGFAGLMYVDLVGIALVISFMKLLYSKDRLLYIFTTTVLLLALIFTQTRNSWLSSGVILILMTVQFILRGKQLGFNRRNIIISVILGVLFLLVTFIVLNSFSSSAFSRLSTSGPKSSEELANHYSQLNSLATRFFIWKTAWNAFTAHPIIGIGFYSFPFVSERYSTIDPFFFKLFVQSRAPHLTLLALLTEAGIIGTIGFFIFMTAIVKYVRSVLKKSKTYIEIFYSNIFFWCIMYIIVSMLMTDAWLWGQLFMLWAIILGFSIANGRIIERNTKLLKIDLNLESKQIRLHGNE